MDYTRIRRSILAALAAASIALVASACGGDGDSDSGSGYGAPSTPKETDSPDETAPDSTAGAASLEVADSDYGPILTDGEGMTLYLFTQDTGEESTCYDQCAENWPPLLSDEDAEAGGDLDGELVGDTERTDGSEQVTYNGHPLYYWQGDEEPGDVNGQGVNDVWYVLNADGDAVEEKM
ncbi:COG4315 family predicted lipoprotein [Salininema proteolyticum]|uniref:Lipoprotein with Yx(FWY)xxD motif n=1 Tax=Salininema proteolyticum TaxID=1607685 RepID=A0ABV8U060_9ACTN